MVADVGTKKGEKVDYAILCEGKPIILFECKKSGGDLNISHASQLFRYFTTTEARFGVLTNGLTYPFFTDLEQPNIMDEKPFFEFNLPDYKERDIEELRKFAKTSFNLEEILATATELKYIRAIQNRLAGWLVSPSEEFVKLLVGELRASRFTPAVKEQFTQITKRAFEQFILERINERLKSAMTPDVSAPTGVTWVPTIVTTDQELEGLHTVRAILRGIISSKRIKLRDAQNYCAILLDDNNRKPICRLWLNTPKLRIGLF